MSVAPRIDGAVNRRNPGARRPLIQVEPTRIPDRVRGEERLSARQLSRRQFVVYSLAATTLTVAAPLGCDGSTAQGAEEPADGDRRSSDVPVTGTDAEMLVLEVTPANNVPAAAGAVANAYARATGTKPRRFPLNF